VADIITCPNCGTRNRVRPTPEGVPRCSACHHHLPWSVNAGPDTFDAELAASVPVLVDFWAPWCGPCKLIEPALDELARERAGRLKIVRLNIDEGPAIAGRYGIQGVPTLMVARDGEEVDRLTGAVPKPRIADWLDRHLPERPPASRAGEPSQT
jgi:thioredoxin 2